MKIIERIKEKREKWNVQALDKWGMETNSILVIVKKWTEENRKELSTHVLHCNRSLGRSQQSYHFFFFYSFSPLLLHHQRHRHQWWQEVLHQTTLGTLHSHLHALASQRGRHPTNHRQRHHTFLFASYLNLTRITKPSFLSLIHSLPNYFTIIEEEGQNYTSLLR